MRTAQMAASDGNQFRELFLSVADPIYISDMTGMIVAANDQALCELGYSEEELFSLKILDLDAVYTTPESIAEHFKLLSKTIPISFETLHRRKDGSLFPVEVNVRLVDFNGLPAVMGVARNVSERKHIEKQLKASEENYRCFAALTSDYIHKCSRKGAAPYRVNWIGGSVEAITGYRAEEIYAQGCWLPLIHPDDRQAITSHLFSLIPGDVKQMEFRLVTKQGEMRWISETARCEAGQEEGELMLFGSSKDITERKQAELQLLFREQALANSERFLKTIIDSEPECIKMLDIDGNLLMMNPAGLEMIEADSFEQVKGKCVCPLITDAYRDEFMELTKRVFQGISGTLEFETIGLKGRRVWLETHAVPFRDEQGEIVALLGITRNVTERKRLEEERVALEHQFQQAQKMESLGVLAGGIAHDFNNLLAVIIGRCSLAKLRPVTAVDNIPQIEIAAQRAAALCQQMLAYAGKANYTQSHIHLGELVDEMVSLSKSTIGQNVVITSDLAVDIPPVTVDSSQIRQVTMNLIINASEAIGQSRGEVRVTLTRKTVRAEQPEKDHLGINIPPGLYACLEVSDNGCGMDSETQLRIFEPFFTTKFTGRGLGMSAVLGIIKTHKGALQLVSHPGQGTTFKVYLPIQMVESSENLAPQQPVASKSWKGTGTILLVEDEEHVICVAEAMLEELGFKAITACNGKEALELYQQHAQEITLVVTDIGMPVMDGYELFIELKKRDVKLPVIISSGFGDIDVTSKISRADIAGLIGKPYNIDQLREVLKDVSERASL